MNTPSNEVRRQSAYVRTTQEAPHGFYGYTETVVVGSDGTRSTYYGLDIPNSVNVVPINPDGQTLIANVPRPSISILGGPASVGSVWYKNASLVHMMPEFPGGSRDVDQATGELESAETAARRELLEEVGAECGRLVILGHFYAGAISNEEKTIYMGEHWTLSQHTSKEHAEHDITFQARDIRVLLRSITRTGQQGLSQFAKLDLATATAALLVRDQIMDEALKLLDGNDEQVGYFHHEFLRDFIKWVRNIDQPGARIVNPEALKNTRIR